MACVSMCSDYSPGLWFLQPEGITQRPNKELQAVRLTIRRRSDRLMVGEKGRLISLFAGRAEHVR